MRQPIVCGEIAAGLILGPSLLGRLFPAVSNFVFDPSIGQIFSILGQLGLVFLMFLIGVEFDFGYLSENRRLASSVSVTGILLPFSLGFGLGRVMHRQLGLGGNWIDFSLFLAAAMSITAIPILGRIMLELNLNQTRLGAVTISAAAVDDVIGWIILALVTAIVRSAFNPIRMTWMIGCVIAYALTMAVFVRPLLCKWTRAVMRANNGNLSANSLAILLTLMFFSAAVTSLIGIFAIFGGFMFGAILYDQREVREAIKRRLYDFVTVFFLPIFFTYTGLRTDMGSMVGAKMWTFCALVLIAAIAGKFAGCTLAARLSGLPLRESSIIGVMMNTRGLMELIVINIGYELAIIPKTVFFMLVFMAVATTYMTAPILRLLIPHSEIWEPYRVSRLTA